MNQSTISREVGSAAEIGARAAAPLSREGDRCIVARDIVKEFHTEIGIRRVLDRISFHVGLGQRRPILGRNGSGKTTLIQILLGLQRLESGMIERGLRMSWPLALGGGFEGELTGYNNIRFISPL